MHSLKGACRGKVESKVTQLLLVEWFQTNLVVPVALDTFGYGRFYENTSPTTHMVSWSILDVQKFSVHKSVLKIILFCTIVIGKKI